MTRSLPAFLLVAALVPSARAQDNPVLPDLAPREIEITGELAIRFPSLRRQPMVGFNPPPRVEEVSPDRRPFAEEYLQRRAELPNTPLRSPVAPAVSPYATGPRFDRSAEAGIGLYAERYLELDVASRARSRTEWRLQADYAGRSGFVPVTAVDGRSASYDMGRLDARAEWPIASAWRLGASAAGSLQRYALFAAAPGSATSANPAPDRDSRSGALSAWAQRYGAAWRLRFETAISASRLATDVFDPAVRVDPRTESSDASVSVDARLETGATDRGLSFAGRIENASVDGSGPASPGALGWRVAAGGRLAAGPDLRVSAGLVLLGMNATREATGSGERASTWLAPEFRAETTRLRGVRLTLENLPDVRSARLDVLFRENPFVVDAPWTESELRPIDAALRAELTLGRLELSGAARWIHSPNRRYFLHDAETFTGYERGISDVRHGRARELGADLDAGAYLGAGVRIRVGGTVRSARLTGLDVDVPYTAPWSLRLLASTSFDNRRGLLQLVGRVEGPRSADLAGTRTLDPFADLDFVASYRIADAATAVVRLQNLAGNRPEWDGYLRPSPLFTVGLRWQF